MAWRSISDKQWEEISKHPAAICFGIIISLEKTLKNRRRPRLIARFYA
jgi:hypothetical protein